MHFITVPANIKCYLLQGGKIDFYFRGARRKLINKMHTTYMKSVLIMHRDFQCEKTVCFFIVY